MVLEQIEAFAYGTRPFIRTTRWTVPSLDEDATSCAMRFFESLALEKSQWRTSDASNLPFADRRAFEAWEGVSSAEEDVCRALGLQLGRKNVFVSNQNRACMQRTRAQKEDSSPSCNGSRDRCKMKLPCQSPNAVSRPTSYARGWRVCTLSRLCSRRKVAATWVQP